MRASRIRVSIAAIALVMTNLPLAAPLVLATAGPCGTSGTYAVNSGVYSCTWTATSGGAETLTLPSTVSSINVDMVGGKGGDSGLTSIVCCAIYGHGGWGAHVVANGLPVTAGATLSVVVAGNGSQGSWGTGGNPGSGGPGGAGGGGNASNATQSGTKGGGGGGGASSVKVGSTPIAVAGGGGGAGGSPGLITYSNNGGNAGNTDGSGGNGGDAGIDPPHCNGGAGATISGNGAGGNSSDCNSTTGGADGSGAAGSGVGGAGNSGYATLQGSAGGGGGGYYGGGGGEADLGGPGSGGGAGSSYPASATITTDSTGTPTVKVSWSLPAPSVSGTVNDSSNNQPWAGTEVTGAQAYGTATIGKVNSVNPTGNVTYSFYAASDCSGSPTSTEQVSIDGSGNVPDSLATGALGAGSYSLQTSYGGDSNYAANTDCDNFDVDSPPAVGGEGTMSVSPTVVSAGQTGRTLTFTYTAAGTMTNGVVRVTVPTGWSAPSLTSTAAGRSTASAGTVSISTRTIVVSGVNLSTSQTLTITYGSKSSGGPGAVATLTPGAQSWTAEQFPDNSGSPTALAVSPSVTVYAKDGSGTNTTPTLTAKKSTFKTIVFTYTAAAGGMSNGSVTLKVPTGWTAPTLTSSANGYVTASAGTVSISGRVVTVSNLTLSGGATLTITYGSTAGGGAGGKAPITAVGLQTWKTKQKSTSGGTLTALAASPKIKVTK